MIKTSKRCINGSVFFQIQKESGKKLTRDEIEYKNDDEFEENQVPLPKTKETPKERTPPLRRSPRKNNVII